MIELTNIESSPIVEMSVHGKLTKDDIQEMNEFFEDKVNKQETVNILLQMESWEGMTFKGLLADFTLIKQMKKIKKAAIVADSALLKANAKVENLFPGIKVEYFELNEMTSARRWLEDQTLDNETLSEHLYE